MNDFDYTAITRDGHRETGVISAASLAAAGHQLKEQGLLPTSLSEHRSNSLLAVLQTIGTVSLEDKIGFVENLSVMMKAGISISRSLQIQVKQIKNPKFKAVVTDIAQQVESGKALGEAMAKYPDVFSNIFISMVKVGEMSGNLEKSMEYLSVQLQRDADLRSKTRSAMIYPAVIVGAMVIIGVLMSIFVLPKLTSVFKDVGGGQLPVATQVVMTIADFMGGHAVIAIVLLIAIVAGVYSFCRTKLGSRWVDWLLLHFMVISAIVKKINLARFARILSSLLKSGIPIVQALEVASGSMGNVWYQDLLSEAAVNVKLGKPLTAALAQDYNLFPIIVVQMLQVGEESGTVEDILSQLAQHYEEEVDVTLRNLSSVIEPLLLLFIGGIVGVLAMALIAPIYQISQNIQ